MQEDGPVRYCGECAWEDPNNPEVPPPPAGEKEEHAVQPATMQTIGTKQLGEMCRGRIAELEREVDKVERAHRERLAAAKLELTKLRKIVAFCDTETATKPSTRKAGAGKNSWTCPDCGHTTVSRWVQRHKTEECPARQAAS